MTVVYLHFALIGGQIEGLQGQATKEIFLSVTNFYSEKILFLDTNSSPNHEVLITGTNMCHVEMQTGVQINQKYKKRHTHTKKKTHSIIVWNI